MASFIIEGGHQLSGTIVPQGAKNEALQVICATLLTSEAVTISNIPNIRDVNNLIQLLRDIGVKISPSEARKRLTHSLPGEFSPPSEGQGEVSAYSRRHAGGRPGATHRNR